MTWIASLALPFLIAGPSPAESEAPASGDDQQRTAEQRPSEPTKIEKIDSKPTEPGGRSSDDAGARSAAWEEQPAEQEESPPATAQPDPFGAREPEPRRPASTAQPEPSSAATPAPTRPESPAPAPVVRKEQKNYPDRPVRYRIEALIDFGTTTITDSAYQGFDDGRNAFTLGAGARADFRLADSRFFLGGGAVYRQLGSEGSVYQSVLDNEVVIREPLLFVRASVRVLDGLDLYLEPGGGPSIVDVTVAGHQTAEQREILGMFNGVGGITAYLPKQWLPRRGASRLTAGIDLGFGYTFRNTFDIEPELQREDDAIQGPDPILGDIDLRGFVWRGGLFLRFM